MNALGVDVSGLDVGAFLAAMRHGWAALGLVAVLLLAWRGRPAGLLAIALVGNAWVWAEANLPLQRLYALGPSSDRINNLGLCQVVAAGNSPLRMPQVGQLHFDPGWGALLALVSGWSPDRLLALYPFLPLAMAAGFAACLYGCWRASEPDHGLGAWEAGVVSVSATLLVSLPTDFGGTYRDPWMLTFLLKPNHALGLVLLPPLLAGFARMRGWRDRLLVGLLLHLMAWAFVLHMVFAAVGLVAFAVLGRVFRAGDGRRDTLDVAGVLGANLVVVSPALFLLFSSYPVFQPTRRGEVPAGSPHLLEPTLLVGVVFPLAVWGALLLWRRGGRLPRLLASQYAAALAIWVGMLLLSRFRLARELDEIFYWNRFLAAVLAGVGAWDLAGRVRVLRERGAARRAAALLLLALPWTLPYWWDPLRMDRYFAESLAPLPEAVQVPTDWIRERTDRGAVFAGDTHYARWVAALGARRVLVASRAHATADYPARHEFLEHLLGGEWDDTVRRGVRRWGVSHVVVTPRLLDLRPEWSLERLRGRAHLAPVLFWGREGGDFVAVFEIRPEAG